MADMLASDFAGGEVHEGAFEILGRDGEQIAVSRLGKQPLGDGRVRRAGQVPEIDGGTEGGVFT